MCPRILQIHRFIQPRIGGLPRLAIRRVFRINAQLWPVKIYHLLGLFIDVKCHHINGPGSLAHGWKLGNLNLWEPRFCFGCVFRRLQASRLRNMHQTTIPILCVLIHWRSWLRWIVGRGAAAKLGQACRLPGLITGVVWVLCALVHALVIITLQQLLQALHVLLFLVIYVKLVNALYLMQLFLKPALPANKALSSPFLCLGRTALGVLSFFLTAPLACDNVLSGRIILI